jgi:hypothetical protein
VASSEVRGKGKLCDMEGKILLGASINKPGNTVCIETSYWTDEEDQRISFTFPSGYNLEG